MPTKIYHIILLALPFLSITFFSLFTGKIYTGLALVIAPVIVVHLKKVLANQDPKLLDPELKKIALTTLLYSLLFGMGTLIV